MVPCQTRNAVGEFTPVLVSDKICTASCDSAAVLSWPAMLMSALQAPEDGTDVVTAASRVITEPGLNTLGLKDKRDIVRLVAQSALQVCVCLCLCGCLCVYVSLCLGLCVCCVADRLCSDSVSSSMLHC